VICVGGVAVTVSDTRDGGGGGRLDGETGYPRKTSLLVIKHLNSRIYGALRTLRIHAGHDPPVDNVVIVPDAFGPNIYTNFVSTNRTQQY
jgi:hypothetical protein